MSLSLLMDENVDPLYKKQLLNREPDLVVWQVGEPGTPPKGTLDSEILIWCEVNDFALVTNNRASMPVHLAEHIAQNRHVPGIFILNPNLSIGQNIDDLTLIALVSFEKEHQDQIVHLPLRS